MTNKPYRPARQEDKDEIWICLGFLVLMIAFFVALHFVGKVLGAY